ncbi:MAG: zf-HC2 domain-containing protein [Anaerolineae bacterium]|nr:zf-HC2 domain-containing protein [Anaerolineae bacterium]
MNGHPSRKELISYLYEALTEAEQAQVEQHLRVCPECQPRLAEQEAIRQQLRAGVLSLQQVTPPAKLTFAAIAPRLKRPGKLSRVVEPLRQPLYSALTLAVLVAFGVGLYALFSGINPLTVKPTPGSGTPVVISTIDPTQPPEFVWKISGDPNPFAGPNSLTVDSQGHLYVLERNNNRIQKFDGEGRFLLRWGSPGSNAGQFSFFVPGTGVSGDVAVDSQGQVYVADPGNARVQKFDSQGQFLSQWSRGDGQFIRPGSLIVDNQDNLYVLDDGTGYIHKFDRTGQFLTRWGGIGGRDGEFTTIQQAAADAQGNIYVVDVSARIQKFDPNGQFLGRWGTIGEEDGQFLGPSGVAIDAQGYIHISDTSSGRIQIFDQQGQFLAKWGSQGTDDGQFTREPTDIAIDKQGNIYISDFYGNNVQKFRQPRAVANEIEKDRQPTDSIPEFVWKISGDPNPLSHPSGLGIDAQGNIYVVDTGNNRIQKFDSEGQFLMMWGSPGSGEGQFNFIVPKGAGAAGDVAVDSQGNIYVADSGNTRIQKFNAEGQFLTQWGSPGAGDGQFQIPFGLAIDEQDNVYVVDDNAYLQKFDGQGQFLIKWGGAGFRDGEFSILRFAAADGQGHIYVTDRGTGRIQKFDRNGQFLGKWGSAGLEDGQFAGANGIAIDEQGYVYVTDLGNPRVQKFDSRGKFLFNWGSQGQGDGQFGIPADIAVDRQGNIYISDYDSSTIQKFR